MKLSLGGYLAFYGPQRQGKFDVSINTPTLLCEILTKQGIPVSEVYLTVVNGEQAAVDDILVRDSDDVRLYPPIDGG